MRKSLLILDAVVFLDNRRLPSLQNLRTLYLQSDVKEHNVPSHLKHGPTKRYVITDSGMQVLNVLLVLLNKRLIPIIKKCQLGGLFFFV